MASLGLCIFVPCFNYLSIHQSINATQDHKCHRLALVTAKILLVMSTGVSVCAVAAEAEGSYPAFDFGSTLIKPSYLPLSDSALIGPPTATVNEVAPQVDLRVMVTAHSPAQPIAAFIKEWDAPLNSGKHAYAQGRASLDIRPASSAISYGLGWRYDYLMEFNQETAELYWQYQNKQLPNQNRSYPVQLEAKHNERIGANIGFTQQLATNWQLTTHGNIWQGLHALEGNALGVLTSQALLEGEAIRNIDRLNSVKADLNYYYDKPALKEENLNWYPDKPTGYGYSLDAQLIGQLSDKTTLEVRGYDVLGRMHWKDMPSTEYILDYDINRATTDDTRGQLRTNNVTQTLPWRVESSLQHQLNSQWQFGIHGQVNAIQGLYQLSAGYHPIYDALTAPITITGLVEPQTKALGLALESRYAGIKLLTDSLDSEKAKRSEISLYGRYKW